MRVWGIFFEILVNEAIPKYRRSFSFAIYSDRQTNANISTFIFFHNHWLENRNQKTENWNLKTEIRKQKKKKWKSENRNQKTEIRNHKTEITKQKSQNRNKKQTEITENRNHNSLQTKLLAFVFNFVAKKIGRKNIRKNLGVCFHLQQIHCQPSSQLWLFHHSLFRQLGSNLSQLPTATDRISWNRQVKIKLTSPCKLTSSHHQPTQVNQDSQN